MLIHWGRNIPDIFIDLATEMRPLEDNELHLSYVDGSPTAALLDSVTSRSLKVSGFDSVVGILATVVKVPVRALRLVRYLRRNHIDVMLVVMESIWLAPAYAFVRRLTRTRIITIIHDGQVHPGDRGMLFGYLRSRALRHSAALICLSDWVEAQVREAHPSHDLTIYRSSLPAHGAVAVGEPRSVDGRSSIVIGFFGRILHYKGLSMLLDAVEILRDTYPGLVVRIAGNGDMTPYEAQCARIGGVEVENRWIDNDEIADIIGGFDLLALPYIEASQSAVLVLAMAQGVPVVATPVGGIAEHVLRAGCGVVAEAVSAEEFATSVRTLLEDPALYAACSQAGSAAAGPGGSLSPTCIAREIQDIAVSVLEGPQASSSLGTTNPGATNKKS